MKFQNIIIPNGKSALAGLVLYQSWTFTNQKNSDCHQSAFIKKIRSFLY